LVEQWSSSGETAERFAARVGVKPATLARWRKAVSSKSHPGGSLSRAKKSGAGAESVFAQVQVVEPSTRSEGLIELVTRDGLIVRVHGSVDVDALGAVLGCVSRC
jgi:transposase-like protein